MQTAILARLGGACLALVMLGGADRPHPPGPLSSRGAMLPDRLLTCTIGHIINFDPHKEQTAADLRSDGMHEFALFLPAIPVPIGRPRDASEAAAPVNPRTRIVNDPDHIAGQPRPGFGRIVDLWPDRVELSATIAGPLLNTITITPINTGEATADLFMLRATELTHFDAAHIYQGHCRITGGPARAVRQAGV